MYIHMGAGALALTVGIFQLNSNLRKNRLNLHRILGRIYVVSVLLSGCAGLFLAFNAMGGIVASYGFGSMAVLWLFTVIMAFVQVRKGNIPAHRY
jgi:uncharacterized membrane protein